MQNGNKRVLVIDDNPDMRRTMQALLESEGFDVAVAADGEEGLRLQRSMPAAVVITDIYMPRDHRHLGRLAGHRRRLFRRGARARRGKSAEETVRASGPD